jgi:hypothetical protein
MLVAGLAHVRYTIDQALAWMVWRLRNKEFTALPLDQKQILENACIESGLISLRILNEFFKKEKTKGLIKASHYMGSKSPGAFLTTEEERRINDHLAHLTWERVSDPSPPWSEELTHRALQRCHIFLEYVLKHFLGASDPEHTPCLQEFEAITQYLEWAKRLTSQLGSSAPRG